jgi:hypothetical protein
MGVYNSMPIFDIQCEICKDIREIILPVCPDDYKVRSGCETCNCNSDFEILPPLTNMQPDNMWAGKQTDLGYFNSKKQYKDYIKNNNLELATRNNYESVQKKSKTRVKDAIDKSSKSLEKFIEKELSGVEISPDGNTVKEKNKYIKSRD